MCCAHTFQSLLLTTAPLSQALANPLGNPPQVLVSMLAPALGIFAKAVYKRAAAASATGNAGYAGASTCNGTCNARAEYNIWV